MGKEWKQCQTLFSEGPKSLQMVITARKLKDAYFLEGKLWPTSVQFSSVQSLSHVQLFVTPWIAASQAFLSTTNFQSSPNSCASSWWCHPAISSSVIPFSSCPQSLPSGSFPMSQLFTSGGKSTRVSASAWFSPKKSQGWSPSEWTGWISLQSKGLSRVFSNTIVQKHQLLSAQHSSQSNSHIHTRPLEKPYPWLNGPLLAK